MCVCGEERRGRGKLKFQSHRTLAIDAAAAAAADSSNWMATARWFRGRHLNNNRIQRGSNGKSVSPCVPDTVFGVTGRLMRITTHNHNHHHRGGAVSSSSPSSSESVLGEWKDVGIDYVAIDTYSARGGRLVCSPQVAHRWRRCTDTPPFVGERPD